MEENLKMEAVSEVELDDEHDSKESVVQRYFLQEWKRVKSLLDDIISNGRVSDISSVHKIRSIVLSLYLSIISFLCLNCITISSMLYLWLDIPVKYNFGE